MMDQLPRYDALRRVYLITLPVSPELFEEMRQGWTRPLEAHIESRGRGEWDLVLREPEPTDPRAA